MTTKTLNKNLGKIVRTHRINRNYSLSELSKRSKLAKGLLSKIENGKGNPTIDTLNKLAKAFVTTPARFLEYAILE